MKASLDAGQAPGGPAKSWLNRTLDLLTYGLVAVALWTAHNRFLMHPAPVSPTEDAERVEKQLAGRIVPPLQLTHAGAGRSEEISFSGRRRLVFIFSSTCAACQRTEPSWDDIAGRTPPGVDVLAISAEHPVEHQTFFRSDRVEVLFGDYQKAFSSPYVPLTAIVTEEGRIQFAKIGVLTETDASEIVRRLGAPL